MSFAILLLASVFFDSFASAFAFALAACETMAFFALADNPEGKGFPAKAKQAKEQAEKLGWCARFVEALLLVATLAK